jgi:hypothetical protein
MIDAKTKLYEAFGINEWPETSKPVGDKSEIASKVNSELFQKTRKRKLAALAKTHTPVKEDVSLDESPRIAGLVALGAALSIASHNPGNALPKWEEKPQEIRQITTKDGIKSLTIMKNKPSKNHPPLEHGKDKDGNDCGIYFPDSAHCETKATNK